MAFEWITGNTPQFWKNYVALFETDERLRQKRYVVFDTEATGIDSKEDTISAIGAVGIEDNALVASDFFEIYLVNNNEETARETFKGMLKENGGEKFVEAEAIIQFLNFIRDAVLVSQNVNEKVEMINQSLKRLNLGGLKNTVMDTAAMYAKWQGHTEVNEIPLNELAALLHVTGTGRHNVAANAYTNAMVFLKLKNKLNV